MLKVMRMRRQRMVMGACGPLLIVGRTGRRTIKINRSLRTAMASMVEQKMHLSALAQDPAGEVQAKTSETKKISLDRADLVN